MLNLFPKKSTPPKAGDSTIIAAFLEDVKNSGCFAQDVSRLRFSKADVKRALINLISEQPQDKESWRAVYYSISTFQNLTDREKITIDDFYRGIGYKFSVSGISKSEFNDILGVAGMDLVYEKVVLRQQAERKVLQAELVAEKLLTLEEILQEQKKAEAALEVAVADLGRRIGIVPSTPSRGAV